MGDISPSIQCIADNINPLKDYLDSLRKLQTMDIETVFPGHRGAITDPRVRLAALMDHHHQRIEEILSILKQGPQNAFQLASRMTWSLPYPTWDQVPDEPKWFATGEALAHLRYLENKKMVTRSISGEMCVFLLA